MTTDAVRAGTPRAATLPSNLLTGVTLVAGCVALLARPVSDAFIPITIAVAIAGALHPRTDARAMGVDRGVWIFSVAIGAGAFAAVRGALGPNLLPPPTGWLLGSVVVAAFAEEAFFRRFAYDAFIRWGAPVAIAASSLAFAIVHVTLWGWRAVPVDLAAGLLLGWQRWATGSWTAPAVTHAAANIAMLV